MKIAKKRKKPEPEPVPEKFIDEVQSVEDMIQEASVTDLQKDLAEAEWRLDNLAAVVESEVEARVQKFMSAMGGYLAAAELRMFSRMSEFFMQNPLWEIHKLTKALTGAGDFYNPYAEYKRLTNAGWKFMGRHFDPNKMEAYDLFVRQKELPQYLEKIKDYYKEFQDRQNPVTLSAKRPTGVKSKATITNKK